LPAMRALKKMFFHNAKLMQFYFLYLFFKTFLEKLPIKHYDLFETNYLYLMLDNYTY